MNRKGRSPQQQPPSESWEDFHQQYHSSQFRNSANNPSILQRMGQVPKSFGQKESSKNLVDHLLLMREDSVSSLSGSSSGGSERGLRSKDVGRRRSQGNIKIGKTPKQSKRWSVGSLLSWK